MHMQTSTLKFDVPGSEQPGYVNNNNDKSQAVILKIEDELQRKAVSK